MSYDPPTPIPAGPYQGPAAVPTAPADPSSAPGGPVRIRGRMLRLMLSLTGTWMFLFLAWGAIPTILLPLQVQSFDAHAKATNLAIVTTLGAIAALISQPLAGMVSDRTRSRFGPRGPWMLIGGVVGGIALASLGAGRTVLGVTIIWVVVQVAYNFAQGPLTAVLPDRVPTEARGRVSAFIGLGLVLGTVGGQIVGASFSGAVPAGYITLAALSVLALVAFVLLNPERSNRAEPRSRLGLAALVKAFWINPIKHPDFAFGFTGRILLYVGYYLVYGYQLYILQDYVGLGSRATAVIPVLGVTTLLTAVAAALISGVVSDRLRRRKAIVVVASLLIACALAIPLITPTVGGMIAYSALSGLGFGTYTAVDNALMADLLPSASDRAKDLGVLNIAGALPQVVGPALSGLIVSSLGGYVVLFPVGIVLGLAGAAAILFIRSVR
jgi:MFS family permease